MKARNALAPQSEQKAMQVIKDAKQGSNLLEEEVHRRKFIDQFKTMSALQKMESQ